MPTINADKPEGYSKYEDMWFYEKSDHPLVLFSSEGEEVFVHKIKTGSHKTEIQCNRGNTDSVTSQSTCELCRRSYPRLKRFLIPVFHRDWEGGLVRILPIVADEHSDSLGPQILPFLREFEERRELIAISILYQSYKKFKIEKSEIWGDEPYDPLDDEEAKMDEFLKDAQEGKVFYQSVFPSWSNERIIQILCREYPRYI